jgi:hypothetical protein
MSRCVLDDEDRSTEVAIGWDPGMGSFFARVFDNQAARRARQQGADDHEIEQAGLVLWTGGFDCRYTSLGDLRLLIAAIQPYAGPHDPDRLCRELLRDQGADDGERRYSLIEDDFDELFPDDDEEDKGGTYDGPGDPEAVTESDVHRALGFLIAIEPDEVSSREEYDAATARYRDQIDAAVRTLRRFAEQIEPKSIETMRAAYYGFTNGPAYLRTSLVSAVVTSALNEAWEGVGPWRR